MTDTYEDLIRRLRETHDNLNTIATPSGFKTPETHHAEFEQAMALCWKSADVIAALVKKIEVNDRPLNWRYTTDDANYQRGLRDGERIGLEKAAKVAKEYGDAHAGEAEELYAEVRYARYSSGYTISRDIRALITQEQSDDDKV